MTRHHRIRAATLAVAAVATLMVALPGTGTASGTATTERVTTTDLTSTPARPGDTLLIAAEKARSTDGSAGVDSGPSVIYCYVSNTNPTLLSTGGPYPANSVYVSALLYCTWPVDQLSIDVTLYWNYNVWAFDGEVGVLRSEVDAFAIQVCANGAYYGVIDARVVFPPNYYPRAQGRRFYTSFVNITCP